MAEYIRPGTPVRVMNSLLGVVIKLGFSPQGGQLLTVNGRKSGRPMTTPVNPLTVDGAEYLVAPRGNTHWTRNLKASGSGVLRRGRKKRPIRVVHDLADDEKPKILLAYLGRWGGVTRGHFGITWPNPSAEEVARVCARTPIFRIENG